MWLEYLWALLCTPSCLELRADCAATAMILTLQCDHGALLCLIQPDWTCT